MKISELKTGITYILCPDCTCRKYFDMTRLCPCDHSYPEGCPRNKEKKFLVVCLGCHKPLILDGNHKLPTRITHAKSKGGCGADFWRSIDPDDVQSVKYQILYEMPTED
jgi:hypothetical protein